MARSVLAAALALAAACALAGCGGGEPSADRSGPDLARWAPAGSAAYAELLIRPRGDLGRRADALAARLGEGGDFAGEIARLLEFDGRDAERFDFGSDVEPWLGSRLAWFPIKAGFAPGGDVDGVTVLAVRDRAAARRFVDEFAEGRERRYRGVRYALSPAGDAVAFAGGAVLVGDGAAALKAAINARSGESLADLDRFAATMAAAPEGSLTDVYLDLSGLVAELGDSDFHWQGALAGSGFDADHRTALASVLPDADSAEIEVRTAVDWGQAPEGDVAELLVAMPADSAVALGFARFGRVLAEQFEALDESGIPGEVPPDQFRAVFEEAGIDLDAVAAALGDAAGYIAANGEGEPRGALTVESDDPRRVGKMLADLGFFLRSTGVPGVTGIDAGAVRGFAIAGTEIGEEPIAFAADRRRVAAGYGIAPAVRALKGAGRTLADVAAYGRAIESLGETPPYGFVDGPRALRLLDAEYAGDGEYRELRPYLERVATIAIGAERDGELSLTRLIVHPKR